MNKAELEAEVEILTAENAATDSKLQLAEEIINDLTAEIAGLKVQVAEFGEFVKEVGPKKEAEKPKLLEPFEVDGKIIKIKRAAFIFEGQRVTAEQLKANPEMIEKLISIGSGVLQIVGE
jgi:hypothetical protein